MNEDSAGPKTPPQPESEASEKSFKWECRSHLQGKNPLQFSRNSHHWIPMLNEPDIAIGLARRMPLEKMHN